MEVFRLSYEKAFKKYIEATNTHDFSNVKELLHENAVYWFTDKTCITIDEIQSYFENAWDVIKEEVYTATDINWLAIDENTAICIYTYIYKGYHMDKFVSGSGRATNVFIKNEKEEWKLIHEHLSSL